MLHITIPAFEGWDESKQVFINLDEQKLQLEHSLVSVSKWESKWNKAFLSKQDKTIEETLDYIRCMTITQNVKPDVYLRLTSENIEQINEYVDAPMTATYFNNDKNKGSSHEVITSELIYYWMIVFNIPFECQKWHLNRLLTLIKVCEVKNSPKKTMSKQELMARNKALNEERRRKLNTKG